MTSCARRRCCSLRRTQANNAVIEQVSQMEAANKPCRCGSTVSFTKSLNSYEGNSKHSKSASNVSQPNCLCPMRRSISQKSFPKDKADFSFRQKKQHQKSFDSCKSNCSHKRKSSTKTKTSAFKRMIEYSNNLARAKSQISTRALKKSSQKKKKTPSRSKSVNRTFSNSKSSSKQYSRVSLDSVKRHRRNETSRFSKKASSKKASSKKASSKKNKRASSMKKSGTKSRNSSIKKRKSVDFNNNYTELEIQKSMRKEAMKPLHERQPYFSQDLYNQMQRSHTAQQVLVNETQEPISDHFASFACQNDICASKSGSANNTQQINQKFAFDKPHHLPQSGHTTPQPRSHMKEHQNYFSSQQQYLTQPEKTYSPSRDVNELKSLKKWSQALDRLGSLHNERLTRLHQRAEHLIHGAMNTNEIVKVLVSHPETQEFAVQRVDELVAAGLNTDQEMEIDKLQRHLIEMQARNETAEDRADQALKENERLRTYLQHLRQFNPNLIENDKLEPVSLSSASKQTTRSYSAMRKELEQTSKGQHIITQDQIDKSRQRELTLKTDLQDIQARELSGVKESTKAKYREKMIQFEKECSLSLRTKLSDAENALRIKYETELTDLRSQMVEIKDHEEIVNKQLENYSKKHQQEMQGLYEDKELLCQQLDQAKVEYGQLQSQLVVAENQLQTQILQKDHEIRSISERASRAESQSEEKLYSQLRKVIEEKAKCEKELFEATLTHQAASDKTIAREQQLLTDVSSLKVLLTAERDRSAALENSQAKIDSKNQLFVQKEAQKHQKQLQKYVWALTSVVGKVTDLRSNLELLSQQSQGEITLLQETIRHNCEVILSLSRRREHEMVQNKTEIDRVKVLLENQEAMKQEIMREKCTNEKLQRELNEKVLEAAMAAGRSEQENLTKNEKIEQEKARNVTLEDKLSQCLRSEADVLSTQASLKDQVTSLHKEKEEQEVTKNKLRSQLEHYSEQISHMQKETNMTNLKLNDAQYVIEMVRQKKQKKRDASAKKRKTLERVERALGESIAKASMTLGQRNQFEPQAEHWGQYYTSKQPAQSAMDLRGSSASVTGFLSASQMLMKSRGAPQTQEFAGRRKRSPMSQARGTEKINTWSREQKENLKLSRQNSNFLQRRAAGLCFDQ